jgi:hypothetical protein
LREAFSSFPTEKRPANRTLPLDRPIFTVAPVSAFVNEKQRSHSRKHGIANANVGIYAFAPS